MGAKVSAETPPRTVLNLHSLYGFAHMRVQAHADMGGKGGQQSWWARGHRRKVVIVQKISKI